ncbi:hypothetical protein LTR37_008141 [Vermiconidia calcicola]|uniref:Uncharacterized protein n=1 Tax=Vermiconidia calcicola TaxID=1690605 RepID=A0ACC3NCH3_9PEZI|nr:hypothetical protein LTR37_008141 [Vermiconidia calcicola]
MLPPGLKTPREVTLYYDSIYDSLIDSGRAVPFLYPWSGIGAFAALAYLLIDHRHQPTLKRLRLPLFALLFAFQCWVIATNIARHPAGALGVGLLSAWGILWISTIAAVSDCQTDFVRIEQGDAETREDGPKDKGTVSNGSPSNAKHNAPEDTKMTKGKDGTKSLYWQSYPTSFRHRIDWVADVFCSFRGVGWNFQTTTVPPPPKPIEMRLSGKEDSGDSGPDQVSRSGIRRFMDRESLLQHNFTNLVIGYLSLDLVKVLMHHDAYFWGYVDASPPSYLPLFVQDSYPLVRSYRLVVGLAGMYTALWEIFQLGPAFFCGVLGPRCIGLRGEPWMNPPDMFGAFAGVLDNGIAGWWSGWWHQVFRVAFEAHSTWLLKTLNIEKRSQTGQLTSLFVAFFLSACLHACGSFTLLGQTRPLMGPFRFFLLQPIGIAVQMLAVSQLSKLGITQRTPKMLKRTVNFLVVHTWLYFTGPLLLDDFAKGGVWLFEPVALSPLRLLGLGAKDDRFFCWWDGIVFWRSGKHWWDTGIAL